MRGPVRGRAAPTARSTTTTTGSWRAYPDPDDPDVVPVGLDELFTSPNLPSYRLLIDMGDLDGARIVITTGQSGMPFDAHYTDQIEPWRTGGTLPLPFTPAAIEAATVATVTLDP